MKNKVGRICTALGALLVLAALMLWDYNDAEATRAEATAQELLAEVTALQADPAENTALSATPETAQEENFLGVLTIPALDLELPVYATCDDERMKDTVCRYSGSTDTKDLVIAGHNYKKHFGGLTNLQPGDEVTLQTMDGNTYTYQVMALETLNATAVDEMTSGEYALTLFTCDYSGNARIAVRCQPTF